ncbi:MAG: double-strand break repair protein AddB, partial [Rhodobacterales bacterium]|nr:double-strand break repair protein AddB [Rhodobacterales bacterium]
MTDRAPPALYTIPPGTPFVDALAAGLLDRAGADPQALSAMRVLLPTQRACRALREAFLRQSGGRPLLLPRLTALGEMDEEELVLSEGEGAGDADGEGALDLPPALAGLTRQLLLARLIRQRQGDDTRPEQAARLAAELARLLDQVRTERLDFAQLADLAPQDYATHWGDTLAFLTVLTEHWPGVLAERGALDAADRRNRLLERQAEAWHRDPPAFPVIAAGTTGSIPATADLLDRVARLPQGCVVLPGLDRDTPDAAWADLPPSHPQYGLARLLARLKVDRGAVK